MSPLRMLVLLCMLLSVHAFTTPTLSALSRRSPLRSLDITMGRGDKRTAKGKRKSKSFGVYRPRNSELRKRAAAAAEPPSDDQAHAEPCPASPRVDLVLSPGVVDARTREAHVVRISAGSSELAVRATSSSRREWLMHELGRRTSFVSPQVPRNLPFVVMGSWEPSPSEVPLTVEPSQSNWSYVL
eukprot:CAMPEP_0195588930 /NCGR_PEP_ID=MMETSP0814-20130614/33381_1 /TAXON_ID=97485 /ORGANISM="Prymnesium parvum, Strain Texoma1" /LENGTH=184 /DNA_ID=CAMNT_0040727951 /DNA_START=61 /DNA_END=617 /DNA_ORIENTATION=+